MIEDVKPGSAPDEGWLIHDLVADRGMTLLLGLPNTFKSFIALDIALSIASGRSFHGHPTTQGGVCFVSGQGALNRLSQRVQSWCAVNNVPHEELDVSLVEESVHLDVEQDVTRFIRSIPSSPSLVVFDTLSACMENNLWTGGNVEKAIKGYRAIQTDCETAVMLVQYEMIRPDEPRLPQKLLDDSKMILTVTRPRDEKSATMRVANGSSWREISLLPVKSGSSIALVTA